MKKILSVLGVSSLVYLFPVVALGAVQIESTFSPFITQATSIVNKYIVPLVFAIAFLMFLFGIFKAFILGGADEGKRSEGRQLMLYSIIGFLLMVSIWGIVNLVQSGLGFSTGSTETITLPKPPLTQ